MDFQEIKAKLADNKLASVAVVVALVAGVSAYPRSDVLQSLEARRVGAESNFEILRHNQLNGGAPLQADVEAMELLHQQASQRALDFESAIAAQAFFSELIQVKGLKIEGIPTLAGAPAAGVKPFATGVYFVQGQGGVTSAIEFARKCEELTQKSLRVERIQFSTNESSAVQGAAQGSGDVSVGLSLRAWGYRAEEWPPKIKAPVLSDKLEKLALTRAQRRQKIDFAKGAFDKRIDLAGIQHLFSTTVAAAPAETTSAQSIEVALKALRIVRKQIFGQPAVAGDRIGTKRIGNSFELVADGTTYKVTVQDVNADFATFLVSGKSIKIPFGN